MPSPLTDWDTNESVLKLDAAETPRIDLDIQGTEGGKLLVEQADYTQGRRQ